MKKVVGIFQGLSITIAILAIIMFLLPIVIGIKPYIVLSGSMEPKIKTGSIVYINTHVDASEIKVNDVIGFSIDNKQVTHRVVEINSENKTFITKGDANNNVDFAPISFEQYKGKNIFSIPYIGKTIALTKTATGKFVVMVVIGLNIIAVIFSNDDEKKKSKEKSI